MSGRSVTHNTFVIERSYPALPERVFVSFSDPSQKRRWFAEGEESELEHFEMDFRVGGASTQPSAPRMASPAGTIPSIWIFCPAGSAS